MINRTKRFIPWAILIGTLLLASCGGSEATSAGEQEAAKSVPTSIPASTEEPITATAEEPTAPTQETSADVGECEAPAAEFSLGSPINSEVVGSDQPPSERKFFCVEVPDGASSVTVELSGTSADLNLYVGHPDLKTVQEGGLWFWYTDEKGAVDKVIEVKPGVTDYVNPGPYYIEVSAQDFQDSSPFRLSASIP